MARFDLVSPDQSGGQLPGSAPDAIRPGVLRPRAAPANTSTCWLVRGQTDAVVTTTIPSTVYQNDGKAVLQAMLTRLGSLRG